MDISQITKKFYKTEKERLEKLKKSEIYQNEIIEAIGKDINKLFEKKIRFMIVNIEPPIINALMIPCCGSNIRISNKIRKNIENKIIQKTQFEEIIWEM